MTPMHYQKVPTPFSVALLRGVNVGGKSLIMDALRKSMETLGLRNVRTYVQSGNLLCDGSGSKRTSERIEERIKKDFGYSVLTIVKTGKELMKILKGNPFLREKGMDPTKLHVTFLSDTPTKEALKALSLISAGDDRFICRGREIYLHCPNGYGRSKLANTHIEKKLGLDATSRNWNTVTALCEMGASDGHTHHGYKGSEKPKGVDCAS